MTRKYDTSTYKKHKRPGGWGSLCPGQMSEQEAQSLLDSGVQVDDAIYNVEDEYCYRSFQHDESDGTEYWHGHPIPWTRLPTSAKKGLVSSGRLDHATYLKAIRKGWGKEFNE